MYIEIKPRKRFFWKHSFPLKPPFSSHSLGCAAPSVSPLSLKFSSHSFFFSNPLLRKPKLLQMVQPGARLLRLFPLCIILLAGIINLVPWEHKEVNNPPLPPPPSLLFPVGGCQSHLMMSWRGWRGWRRAGGLLSTEEGLLIGHQGTEVRRMTNGSTRMDGPGEMLSWGYVHFYNRALCSPAYLHDAQKKIKWRM